MFLFFKINDGAWQNFAPCGSSAARGPFSCPSAPLKSPPPPPPYSHSHTFQTFPSRAGAVPCRAPAAAHPTALLPLPDSSPLSCLSPTHDLPISAPQLFSSHEGIGSGPEVIPVPLPEMVRALLGLPQATLQLRVPRHLPLCLQMQL